MRRKLSRDSVCRRLWKCSLLVMDFDGVMTNNKVQVDQNGIESVTCSRADGLGLEMVRKFTDTELLILSREGNPVTAVRARKLAVPCISGCGNKADRLRELIKERGLTFDAVVYMGNDLNDLACMHMAGLSIAVADSTPLVLRAGNYVTHAKGGEGAVREVCDLLLQAKQVDVTNILE